MRRTRTLHAVAGVTGAMTAVEIVTRVAGTVPPASTVLRSAAGLAVDGEFLADVAASLGAWAEGVLLALVLAVPLATGIGSVPWLGRAGRAVVEFLRPIPSVALIPLAIALFSSTRDTVVSLVCYASLWPILINTLYALRDVDPVARDTLRCFGFGRLSVLVRVSLPSAAPFVATGLRIAASVGLIVVISTELLTGGEGIGGYLVETQTGGGRTDLMLAGAVWAGLLGLLTNAALLRLERRAFQWHTARTAAP